MLIRKFEEAVKQHTSRTAVKAGSQKVTYEELNQRFR